MLGGEDINKLVCRGGGVSEINPASNNEVRERGQKTLNPFPGTNKRKRKIKNRGKGVVRVRGWKNGK